MSTEKFILNKMSKSKINKKEWKEMKIYLECLLKENPTLLIRQDIKTQEKSNIDEIELINITVYEDVNLFQELILNLRSLKKFKTPRICIFFQGKGLISTFEEI